jgi:hypothetical protein
MENQQESMGSTHTMPNDHGMDGAQNPMLASQMLSHSMPSTSPTNPMNWPLHRKMYTTVCGWLFGFGA